MTELHREPHDQTVTARRIGENSVKFVHAQVVAHLSKGLRFTTTGDLIIELVVPPEYVEDALPLQAAVRGIPLSCDFQVWRPYTEARGDD